MWAKRVNCMDTTTKWRKNYTRPPHTIKILERALSTQEVSKTNEPHGYYHEIEKNTHDPFIKNTTKILDRALSTQDVSKTVSCMDITTKWRKKLYTTPSYDKNSGQILDRKALSTQDVSKTSELHGYYHEIKKKIHTTPSLKIRQKFWNDSLSTPFVE